MRSLLRNVAWRVAPSVMADRDVRYRYRLHERLGLLALTAQFAEVHGERVLHGPFEGLVYPADLLGGVPRLLGAYEREIQPWIEQFLHARPARFVNIDAADGYYAVGFAVRGIPTIAFELSKHERARCRRLAAVNGTSVELHGRATSRKLRRLPLDGAFVLSDCEGCEGDIFDAPAVRALRGAYVLVELHETMRPGVTQQLQDRFSGSHECRVQSPSAPASGRLSRA
jgi:hypothetical protein